ncbi:MAG TPA: hypothetical protein PKB02_07225 [Anaerohalosphaeraceae bacterium]|nr:hypothetical protein [Anaerohalosphaeraceae bacterium]
MTKNSEHLLNEATKSALEKALRASGHTSYSVRIISDKVVIKAKTGSSKTHSKK